MTTGDNWNGIMKDGLRQPPDSLIVNGTNITCSFRVDCTINCCAGCDDSEGCKENCCTALWMTPIFMCSFILLAQFVMLNLVVAVLMQELEEAGNDDKKHAAIELEQERAGQLDGGGEGDKEGGGEGTSSVAPLPRDETEWEGKLVEATADQALPAGKGKPEVEPGAPPI